MSKIVIKNKSKYSQQLKDIEVGSVFETSDGRSYIKGVIVGVDWFRCWSLESNYATDFVNYTTILEKKATLIIE